MNLTILIIYIVVGGLIQVVRVLSNEWEWLGSITFNIPYFKGVTIALTTICILAGIIHQVKTEIDKKNILFLQFQNI